MPGVSDTGGSRLLARARAWWRDSTYLGDVALGFTLVTVGNSVMMITGLDEPKTGTFAYVHLLSRLGIVAAVVALFSLDEARAWLGRRRGGEAPGHARRSPETLAREAISWLLPGWLEGTARVFAVLVVLLCLAMLLLAGVRPPEAGRGLYRNLVILAVVLVPLVQFASRWWQQRAGGRPASPNR